MKRFVVLMCVAVLVGCSAEPPKKLTSSTSREATPVPVTQPTEPLPVFTVFTSEYPSWSTLIVAGKAGLVNPKTGGTYGPLELKWGVDVVVEAKDYDPCLTAYSNGATDAVCITGLDALNPALGRVSTGICPTSTSVGADKIIAVGIDNVDQLKGVTTRGLDKSVSRYVHYRGLEVLKKNPADYPFSNLDPAPAATAIQTGSTEIKAICVWNPFALQTLRTAKKSKCLFDSSLIPGEIVDMMVIGNDSLAKPKGPEFACCLCDMQYSVNQKLQSSDPKVADAALTALGKDFSNLPLDDMRIVIQETRFYWTAADGIKWYKSDEFKQKMQTVVATALKVGILEPGKVPSVGYGEKGKQLNFDAQYMEKVASGN